MTKNVCLKRLTNCTIKFVQTKECMFSNSEIMINFNKSNSFKEDLLLCQRKSTLHSNSMQQTKTVEAKWLHCNFTQQTKNVEARVSHALNENWLQKDIFRLKNEKSLISFQENDCSDCYAKNSFCIAIMKDVWQIQKCWLLWNTTWQQCKDTKIRALLLSICFIETFLSKTLHW